jgi:putative spermidine/putrescine transport system substrate-binding protein
MIQILKFTPIACVSIVSRRSAAQNQMIEVSDVKKLSRRGALKLGGWAVAMAAPGTRSAVAAPNFAKGSVLTVSTWGGVTQDAIKAYIEPEFTKLTGATLAYDIGGMGARYNKLLAQRANPVVDVFYGTDEATVSGLKAGIMTPVSRKNVPLIADLESWAFTIKTGTNSDTVASVPVTLGAYVLGYNPQTVKEVPKAWADMWRPDLAGALALAAPVHSAMPQLVIIAAELAGGSAQNIDPGFKKLAELKPLKLTVFWTDWAPLLKSGDVTIATELAYYMEAMKDDKYPIEYVIPKEKGIASLTNLALVTGSRNVELAEAFFNLSLEPAIQQVITAKTYYAPTNKKVALNESVAARCPCGGKIDQIRFFDPELLAAVRPLWTERLNTEVLPLWKTR